MVFIYAELPLNEREQMLANMAAKKETRNYSRSLQPSEVEVEEKRYCTDGMQKDDLEKQLTNIKKEYADKIKAVTDRMAERLEKIRTAKISITGVLFGIPNHANGRMLWYDKWGELVDSRNLLPEELQGRMFIPAAGGSAFEDLPLETQAVINQKLQAQGPAQVDAAAQAIIDGQTTVDATHVVLDPEFTHDEDGWQHMTDAQLMAKYNSVDISLIRTMVLHDDNTYKVPTPPENGKRKKGDKKH